MLHYHERVNKNCDEITYWLCFNHYCLYY